MLVSGIARHGWVLRLGVVDVLGFKFILEYDGLVQPRGDVNHLHHS